VASPRRGEGGVIADGSWLDTSGAVIMLTGLVTVSATAIPLALRPWMENRIREANRREEAEQGWLNDAQVLSVELESLLEKYGVGSLFDQPSLVTAPWNGGMRTRAALVLKFSPDEGRRRIGVELLTAVDLMHNRAMSLLQLRQRGNEATVARATENYEEFHGEAVHALFRFAEALGGPESPPREGFTLPLKQSIE
jgi:hypothetical protein